ncbi:MAG: xanthine dehydrogenase family protein subunit M, partial [Okeania sp. SIO3H1]|nr:xanthine dehydrogenase family protein subunit M [Okeania sp. SIO3H1]
MYSQPNTLPDALRILEQSQPCVIAGGTDIYPALQNGRCPSAFLDVTRIAGFTDISQTDEGVRFGGAVTWTDVINAELPPAFDALKQAARQVGSVQIQNSGTLVGNICNASPAADGVPALLALNASVELTSAARGTRVIPLSAFILGVRQTALEADELATAIWVPKVPDGMGSAFEKLGARRHLVISISMVAALISRDATGRIDEARIAVGACSTVAQRLWTLEADLKG